VASGYMTRGTKRMKRMTGSGQGVDYLYDPIHRISRLPKEKCMWIDRSVKGANRYFPIAIAWSNGDLNPGSDQAKRKLRTRTGGLRYPISEIDGVVGSHHSLQ
jgi:hypothetical protein